MPMFSQKNIKTVNLFIPYYSQSNAIRQAEIDLCLQKNVDNSYIDKIFLLVDDNSKPPVDSPKMEVLQLECRPTYRTWIEESQKRKLQGVSLLANSDIYFDDTVACLDEVFAQNNTFLSLSRWDQTGDCQIPHSDPQRSQDVWGVNCDDQFSSEFLDSLNIEMGIPRCDNKIAYLFAIRGWKLSNPCSHLKSIHVHELDDRIYDISMDLRILGGVAYVHPCEEVEDEAIIDIDVWTVKSAKIQSVALNNMLEICRLERKHGALAMLPNAHHVTAASSHEMLQAVKKGESVFKEGYEFEVLKNKNIYYFKNDNELINSKKISYLKNNADNQSIRKILAPGFIPSVITTHSTQIGSYGKNSADINFWQYPCATEKQAYENHLKLSMDKFIDLENKVINTYLPLPWATYIDKECFPNNIFSSLRFLIAEYEKFSEISGFQLRVHTVCQHIHWRKIIGRIRDIGVTDLHLSHKYSHSTRISKNRSRDLRLHCWPLIAVNYVSPERRNNLFRKPIADKKILASFIGAQMGHYRDESRIELMRAAEVYGKDCVHVELREQWHYNKVVYDEQVQNKAKEKSSIISDIQSTGHYNKILSDSIFSLCPEGAGPNTLRFWESLAIGSIPVIFSDDLAIFQESNYGAELLKCIVHWAKPIDKSLFEHLENMDRNEIERKRLRLIELYPDFESYTIFDSVGQLLDRADEVVGIYASNEHSQLFG